MPLLLTENQFGGVAMLGKIFLSIFFIFLATVLFGNHRRIVSNAKKDAREKQRQKDCDDIISNYEMAAMVVINKIIAVVENMLGEAIYTYQHKCFSYTSNEMVERKNSMYEEKRANGLWQAIDTISDPAAAILLKDFKEKYRIAISQRYKNFFNHVAVDGIERYLNETRGVLFGFEKIHERLIEFTKNKGGEKK